MKIEILSLSFNQDSSCISIGTDSGFLIYSIDPFKEKTRRDFGGGIGKVEMLYRTNYLALIGGGKNPKYSTNKCILWDESKAQVIAELEFRSEIKALRLRRDRIVIVLANKIYVYGLTQVPEQITSFETYDNEKGIVSLCAISNCALLSFPGFKKGHVQLVDLYHLHKSSVSIIPAHENQLSFLSFNMDGSKLATASDKGTLIRVYDTGNGQLLNELRRGSDSAEIYSIAFNCESTRIVSSSDKRTVHVFNIESERAYTDKDNAPLSEEAHNRKSSISFIKGVLPKYFVSNWSFAQIKTNGIRKICTFGRSDSILTFDYEGNFSRYALDNIKGQEWSSELTYNIFASS